MSMNEIDIRKYAGLMEELGLTGLEITEDNKVVRMERNILAGQALSNVPTFGNVVNNNSYNTMERDTGCADSTNSTTHNYITVKSPMVGVFYAAPAENAAPFVNLGDCVEKGKTLCIIEAMKLMNEIHAEEGGEIIEICVANGQMVEYGTELFKIRR